MNFAFLRGGNFGRGLGRFFFLQKGNFRRDLSVSPNIGNKIQVRNFVKSHRKLGIELSERRSAGAEADNSSVILGFRPEVSVTLQGLPTEKSTALSNTFTTIRKHR